MKFGKSLRFWRLPVDEEVEQELRFHVEMRTREYIAAGMDADAARRAAVARFGNVEAVNAACRTIGRQRDRTMKRTEHFSEALLDVRFACRQLWKNPGFSIVAIVTLALGIGATTAIFSAVHAVVLNPLPIPGADRLVAVYEFWRGNQGNVSAGNYVDGIVPASSLESTTAVQYSSFNLADSDDTERIVGARATSGFFDVFGGRAALGRVFTDDDDQPGREQVVVLSHRLWMRRFGADRSVVGRTVRLNGLPYEVIGVMPPSFDLTAQSEELWVPIAFTAERKATHDEHYLLVYGRLRAGVTREQALDELGRHAADLRRRFPVDDAELGFTIVPMMQDLIGDYDRRLFILLGAVAFVLLIACGNVANLLLARGAVRSAEIAVRTALGAGRPRIVRQLLTESVVLAVIAAAAGLALAWSGLGALVAAAPQGVPRLEQASVNPVVVLFALTTSVLCAVVFGLAPAMRAARTDLTAVLKEGGRSAGMGGVRDRLRTALIAGQVAVTLVLLVGAGLLIRSSIALQRVSTGFDANGVLTARLALPASTYADADRAVRTFAMIAERARQIPGVEAAALTSQVPMGAGGNDNGVVPEGKTANISNAISSRLRIVTPGYFETMRIPILRGRGLTEEDRRGALKVMVVSESLARAAFGDQDPIGRRIACCEPGPDGKSPDYKTVVGVAGDVRWRGPGQAPSPEFYLPAAQLPAVGWNWIQRSMYVAMRTSLSPDTQAAALRAVIRDVAPGVPIFNVRTMEQRIGESTAAARFNTLLLTLLGGIALVLAAVGIYGVISYFVTRRTQEIGVRMALGASRGNVVALVLRQAAWPLVIGVMLGLAAAAALTRLLSTQLFGVSATDPATFAAVALALLAAATAATLFPAGRAASVDPTKALQSS